MAEALGNAVIIAVQPKALLVPNEQDKQDKQAQQQNKKAQNDDGGDWSDNQISLGGSGHDWGCWLCATSGEDKECCNCKDCCPESTCDCGETDCNCDLDCDCDCTIL